MAQLTLQQAFDLAVQHHQSGRLQEAEAIYRQILTSQPTHAEAMHYLGVIAHQTKQNDVAVDLIRRAIALRPNYAQAYNNLGSALKDQGQLDEAITAWRTAITLMPALVEAHHNLGAALKDQMQYDEAIAALGQAIALRPNYAQAHLSLGNARKENQQLDEAIAAYRQAMAVRPDYAEAHNNLGNAFRENGEVTAAIQSFQEALRLQPTNAETHFNLGQSLLLYGDFQRGWAEYEWRWKTIHFESAKRDFIQPRWDGGDLHGRTILIYAEQGLGDAIQFSRYVPMVASRGGKVILQCRQTLVELFRELPGIQQVIATGEPLPAFDVHCPLLSLAMLFDTKLETIPATVPYLIPPSRYVENWTRRLGQPDGRPRVGLAWAGSRSFIEDRTRSLHLSQLENLMLVDGVTFYSLQKGYAEEQLPSSDGRIVNLGSELHDMSDTAAVMSLMDLIITTDTSIPHLAGALGRPTWLMLQYAPDWRWLLGRDDSPWYPTMRLFRQKTRGDWGGVVGRVTDALVML